MEIKQRPQAASKDLKGTHPRKCKTCNSWLKNQPDGPPLCMTCYWREKDKEKQQRIEDNASAPVKPNVRIGTI